MDDTVRCLFPVLVIQTAAKWADYSFLRAENDKQLNNSVKECLPGEQFVIEPKPL